MPITILFMMLAHMLIFFVFLAVSNFMLDIIVRVAVPFRSKSERFYSQKESPIYRV